MQYLLAIFLMISLFATATSFKKDISQNANNLIDRINKLNYNLQNKNLDNAVNYSNEAISVSKKLLYKLKEKREFTLNQLQEIATILPEIESITINTQKNIKTSIITYQQLLSTNSQSVLLGNNLLDNQRKRAYMVSLLQVEQEKYRKLQTQLNELIILNNKLKTELNNLNKQLSVKTSTK